MTTIKIDTALIVFPAGGGGNFLASLLFEDKYVRFNQLFNEYKILYKQYYDDNFGLKSATCWFHLDDSVHDNKQREQSVSNQIKTAVAHTNDIQYHMGFGHHIPINTVNSYNLDFPYLLDLTSRTSETDLFLKVLNFYKNTIYTDFNVKRYQISDLIIHIFKFTNRKNLDLNLVLNKIKNVSACVLIDQLNHLITKEDLDHLLVFSHSSLVQWMFVVQSVITDTEITINNFKNFISDDLLCMNNEQHEYTIEACKSQDGSREILQGKYPDKIESIEYGEIFFDLNIPDKFKSAVLPSKCQNLEMEVAKYTSKNLKMFEEIYLNVLPKTFKTTNIILNIKNRFKDACLRHAIYLNE